MTAEIVSLQIRMTAEERDAVRRIAEAEGLSLRELLARWADRHQGAPSAMTPRNDAAMTCPDQAARLDALEARVGALEAEPARAPRKNPAARPAVAEAPAQTADGSADLPTTGRELTKWREDRGWSRRQLGEALGISKQAIEQQECATHRIGGLDSPLTARWLRRLQKALERGGI